VRLVHTRVLVKDVVVELVGVEWVLVRGHMRWWSVLRITYSRTIPRLSPGPYIRLNYI